MQVYPMGDGIAIESDGEHDVEIIRAVTSRGAFVTSAIGIDMKGERFAKIWIKPGQNPELAWKDTQAESKSTNQRNGSLEHLLDAIPPCPAHGVGCIPHAMEWIESAKHILEQEDA